MPRLLRPPDPTQSARAAGLRYFLDDAPGITRRRRGKGFTYVLPDGRPLRAAKDLGRIRALAIPPAWTNVWICPSASGHLQATGRDARGRKQYRYHPRWREARDITKYERIIAFAKTLPRIRQRTKADLSASGLTREKVLATVVQLLERTLIRVGNDEYARANRSFGLTTMRDRHVDVSGASVRFEFRGKSGKTHAVDLTDRRLARIIRRCQDLPGQVLFQCVGEDGERHTVTSSDVNEYLQRITGEEFTSKDFRTWVGTVLAVCALQDYSDPRSKTEAKRCVNRAIENVALRLGNTKAVCRKCYVHPAVLDAYFAGNLPHVPTPIRWPGDTNGTGLARQEQAVLRFLERIAARASAA
jgi:DNA topoisomerase-1